jgi:hypothetical protein
MKVVGADDAGSVCKDCFRDVVRDPQCRQSRTHCAAQIVVDPTGERDGAMILAATTASALSGLIENVARPGENVTGLSNFSVQLSAKRCSI